ncbi:hypothetical protein GCM10010121_066880 [Streptomyces brasiliensis]|uniref:Uncharacterized protein n=2 Tax=Streptomyces brasiliensis TaxID=1954 RepID=A0A917P019_9ACTN|nr:hypothetical protein GCM10010121_066880 [Streptomyces brasiliensis]
MLSVVAVLALLTVWIVTSGGGGGGKNSADGTNGKNPVSTITPGPTGSGPAISQHPGGRDESSGGGTGGGGAGSGGSGDGADDGSGDGSGSPGAGGGAGAGAGAGGGAGAGSAGGVSSGDQVPASSVLPNCTAGSVTLSLRSVHNSYSPDQTPAFELTAKNKSGSDCKIDLGPKQAVLTVTQADSSDDYWSSADCPKVSGNRMYRVPAGSSITYTVKWDRKPSAAQCATPPAGSAGAGTYLLEASAAGFPKMQTSFVLAAD